MLTYTFVVILLCLVQTVMLFNLIHYKMSLTSEVICRMDKLASTNHEDWVSTWLKNPNKLGFRFHFQDKALGNYVGLPPKFKEENNLAGQIFTHSYYTNDDTYFWIAVGLAKHNATHCRVKSIVRYTYSESLQPTDNSYKTISGNFLYRAAVSSVGQDIFVLGNTRSALGSYNTENAVTTHRAIFSSPITGTDVSSTQFWKLMQFGFADSLYIRYSYENPFTYIDLYYDGMLTRNNRYLHVDQRLRMPEEHGFLLSPGITDDFSYYAGHNMGVSKVYLVYNAKQIFTVAGSKINITQNTIWFDTDSNKDYLKVYTSATLSKAGNGKMKITLNMVSDFFVRNMDSSHVIEGPSDVNKTIQVVISGGVFFDDFPPYSGGTVSGTITAYVAIFDPPGNHTDTHSNIFLCIIQEPFSVTTSVDPFFPRKARSISSVTQVASTMNITVHSTAFMNGFLNYTKNNLLYTDVDSRVGNSFRAVPPWMTNVPNSTSTNRLDDCPSLYYLGIGNHPRNDWITYNDGRDEYCRNTYYPDLVNVRQKPLYTNCYTKNECLDMEGFRYVNPYEGGTYDYKGVCVSCPVNCISCDANYTCTQCSNYSQMINGICTCKLYGCFNCYTSLCDACYFSAYGRNIDYLNNITCIRGTQPYEYCDALLGLNKSATYFGNPYQSFPTCQRCADERCKNCTNDNNICTEMCSGANEYPLNLSLVHPQNFMTGIGCKDKSAIVSGFVFNSNELLWVPCIANCHQCWESNYSNCTQCLTGYIYFENEQVCNISSGGCPPYYYPTNIHRCRRCIEHCIKCSASVKCYNCETGWIWDVASEECIPASSCGITRNFATVIQVDGIDSNVCLNCPTKCEECTAVNNCQKCMLTSLIFHEDLIECVHKLSCIDRNFTDFTSNTCKSCLTPCVKCSNYSYCFECGPGLLVDTDNLSCILPTTSGKISMNTTHMADCPQNCKVCTWSQITNSSECTECIDGYIRDAENNCFDCTKPGFMETTIMGNTTCQPCSVELCADCSSDLASCITCKDTYLLDSPTSCVPCNKPHVLIGPACIKCSFTNCFQCHSSGTFCEKCDIGFIPDAKGGCIQLSFKVDSAKFSKARQRITIEFDQNLESVESNFALITVKDHDSREERNVTIISASIQNKTLHINIHYEGLFKWATLNVRFSGPTSVKTSNPYYVLDPKYLTLSIDGATIGSEQLKGAALATAATIGTLVTIVTIYSAIFNINQAILLIKIYQVLEFMLLYNVEYPSSFQNFILIFKASNPLNILPDVFTYMYDDSCKSMPNKIEEELDGCQFFQNSSQSLLLLIALGFGCLAIIGLDRYARKRYSSFQSNLEKNLDNEAGDSSSSSILPHSNNKPRRFLESQQIQQKLNHLRNKIYSVSFTFYVSLSFDLDILLSSAVNSKYYVGDENSTLASTTNVIISQTVIYGYPFLLVYLVNKTYQMPDKPLSSDISAKTASIGKYFHKHRDDLTLIRNFLIAISVIGFFDSPYGQMLSVSSLLLVTVVLDWSARYLQDTEERIITLISDLMYCLCSCFLLLSKASGLDADSAVQKYLLGGSLVVFFSTIVIVNLAPPLWSIACKIREECGKKKKQEIVEKKIESKEQKVNKVNKPISVSTSKRTLPKQKRSKPISLKKVSTKSSNTPTESLEQNHEFRPREKTLDSRIAKKKSCKKTTKPRLKIKPIFDLPSKK